MSYATKEQLEQLAAYMASQINVPTIGIGGGYAPIGAIIPLMGTTAPQDYLACDGTVYNIADYPQLADYFESQFGESNHFGGNGTTTFAVPDLQGEFLRGTGTNSHTNRGSGANVGEHQDGTVINPTRALTTTNPWLGSYPTNSPEANRDSIIDPAEGVVYIQTSVRQGIGNAISRFTSRPTNTSVLYCIKAVVAGEVYSTEERVVGTWIDGKKIYQKTLLLNNITLSANQSNIGDISGIPIDFGWVHHIVGNENGSGYFEGMGYIIAWIKKPANNIGMQLSISGITITYPELYITLCYTKTTD